MADNMLNVRVAIRVRPFNERELRMKETCIMRTQDKQIGITNPSTGSEKIFSFDHCFNSMKPEASDCATQEHVYKALGQEVLESALAGFNACVFAYGQTGSGKTYTMMGSDEKDGLIPQLCRALFARVEAEPNENLSYSISCSYIQIYNERAYDLLGDHSKSLKVREHAALGPYVEGVAKMAVSDAKTISKLMAQGNKARSVAETNMNKQSSRSHAVFIISVTQKLFDPPSGHVGEKAAKISLVDLAGSERQVKSGASGATLREAATINKSLTTLGMVISALADRSSAIAKAQAEQKKEQDSLKASVGTVLMAQKWRRAVKPASPAKKIKIPNTHIPYRDSVLTWLLKENLGGNSKTVMITTLSPAADNFEESMSSLRYADRAKRIMNKPIVNEDATARTIRELRAELEMVKKMLAQSRGGVGTGAGPGGRRQSTAMEISVMKDQVKENERLIEELNESWESKLERTRREMTDKSKQLAQVAQSHELENKQLRKQLSESEEARDRIEAERRKALEALEMAEKERKTREDQERSHQREQEEVHRRLAAAEEIARQERQRRMEAEHQAVAERAMLEEQFVRREEELMAKTRTELEEAHKRFQEELAKSGRFGGSSTDAGAGHPGATETIKSEQSKLYLERQRITDALAKLVKAASALPAEGTPEANDEVELERQRLSREREQLEQAEVELSMAEKRLERSEAANKAFHAKRLELTQQAEMERTSVEKEMEEGEKEIEQASEAKLSALTLRISDIKERLGKLDRSCSPTSPRGTRLFAEHQVLMDKLTLRLEDAERESTLAERVVNELNEKVQQMEDMALAAAGDLAELEREGNDQIQRNMENRLAALETLLEEANRTLDDDAIEKAQIEMEKIEQEKETALLALEAEAFEKLPLEKQELLNEWNNLQEQLAKAEEVLREKEEIRAAIEDELMDADLLARQDTDVSEAEIAMQEQQRAVLLSELHKAEREFDEAQKDVEFQRLQMRRGVMSKAVQRIGSLTGRYAQRKKELEVEERKQKASLREESQEQAKKQRMSLQAQIAIDLGDLEESTEADEDTGEDAEQGDEEAASAVSHARSPSSSSTSSSSARAVNEDALRRIREAEQRLQEEAAKAKEEQAKLEAAQAELERVKREAEEAKARALQVERERQEESERAAAALAAAKAEQKRLEQAKEEELIRLHAMEQAHREAEDARRDDQRRAAAQAEQLAAEAEQARADRESSAKLAELATAAEASRVRALEKCERIKAMIQRLLHDPGFPETPDGRAFDIRTGLPYLAPDSKETPEGVVLEPKSCKGFLVKRGGFHKNLTRRWFSFDLVAKELAYFKDESETNKRGNIPLGNVLRAVAEHTAEGMENHAFMVVTPKRTFYMRADDEAQKKFWIAIINTVVSD